MTSYLYLGEICGARCWPDEVVISLLLGRPCIVGLTEGFTFFLCFFSYFSTFFQNQTSD